MLGQEMDSLADLVSFGVAPATLAFTLGLRTPLDCVALLLFVSGGLARLARFNATVALIPADKSGKSKYFEGLPIPSSLALTAGMAYCVKTGMYAMGKRGGGSLPFGVWTLWGSKGGYGDVSCFAATDGYYGLELIVAGACRRAHFRCLGCYDGFQDA